MDPRKIIVTVAPTGGMATKAQNPNLPTQPEEIAESVHLSQKEGASVVALHARDLKDEATCDPKIYGRINDLVLARCDIVINNSTGGGVSGEMLKRHANGLIEIDFEQRLKGADAGAEMCTLDCQTIVASFNGEEILVNTSPSRCETLVKKFQEKGIKPEWEVFSPEHILQDFSRLIAKGYDKPPYYVNIVLGCQNGFQGAMPYSQDILALMVRMLPPGCIWSVSAIGPAQLPAITQAMLMGGHFRVGLEDNNYYAKGKYATNHELVARAVRIMAELGHEPATTAEAREMIGLPARRSIAAA